MSGRMLFIALVTVLLGVLGGEAARTTMTAAAFIIAAIGTASNEICARLSPTPHQSHEEQG